MARADRPDLGSTRPAAYAVRDGAAARRSAPTRTTDAPGRRRCRRARRSTRCGWSTAGSCSGSPPATSPTTSASTTPPPSCPTSPPAPSRPRWRSPAPRVGEAADAARLAVIAMGKCGGHELNYVSDVDVIFVAEPADGRRRGRRPLRAATQLASHLMRICSDHTGEGTIWPVDANLRPEGKAGPAGAHPRQPPRLLRALGQDLGVPGAAQGPPGRRRPRRSAGEFVELVEPMVWQAAERDGFVERRAGDAAPGRRAHPGPRGRAAAQARLRRAARRRVRRPAAAAGARPRRRARSATPTTLQRAGRASPRAGTSAARTARRCTTAYAVPAHPRAPDPAAASCAAPTSCPTTRRRCAGSGRSHGLHQGAGRGARRGSGAHHRREVRRLHEKLFYRPLLERGRPAARPTRPGSRPRRPRQRLAALGYADPPAALRHLEALTSGRQPHRRRSSAPCCRRCSSGSPTRPTRTPGCSASGGSARRSARRTGTSRRCATRARSPSGWPGCWPPRATPPTCSSASREGVRMLGERRSTPLRAEALLDGDAAPRPSASDDAEEAVRAIRASAAASCSGSRSATCSARSTWPTVGAALSGSPTRRWRRRCDGRRPVGARAARARRGADPDGGRRDGPLRRLRAVLRQRRRRDVRARAAAGRRRARRRRRTPTAVANELRRLLVAPAQRPGAGGRRRPAARGQAGSAGAHARRPTPPTTRSGRRSGRRRRCCAPTRSSATRTCASGSPR